MCYDPGEGMLCCASCSSAFGLDEFIDYEKDWQPSVEQDREELKGPDVKRMNFIYIPARAAGQMLCHS